jgi:N-acetylglucosamine kinase-like BadF-type ATPase
MMCASDKSDGRYLGVDMGGSRTRAYLMQEPAAPRSWQAAGGNLTLDPEAAFDVLLPLVREAAPAGACLGLAGAKTAPAAVAWLAHELERVTPRVTLMTDADLALTAAFGTEAEGIVVCAGTGSVAAVRHAGATHLIGGHGYLLGDAGSAYDIGRQLIAATLRERDRGSESLVDEIEALLGEPLDAFARRVYAQPADRQPLARLAEHVPTIEHAIAAEIVSDAAEALMDLVRIAQERFGPLPVRLAGGVFRIPAIAETLQQRCDAALAQTSPEVAAAQLAAELSA